MMMVCSLMMVMMVKLVRRWYAVMDQPYQEAVETLKYPMAEVAAVVHYQFVRPLIRVLDRYKAIIIFITKRELLLFISLLFGFSAKVYFVS